MMIRQDDYGDVAKLAFLINNLVGWCGGRRQTIYIMKIWRYDDHHRRRQDGEKKLSVMLS